MTRQGTGACLWQRAGLQRGARGWGAGVATSDAPPVGEAGRLRRDKEALRGPLRGQLQSAARCWRGRARGRRGGRRGDVATRQAQAPGQAAGAGTAARPRAARGGTAGARGRSAEHVSAGVSAGGSAGGPSARASEGAGLRARPREVAQRGGPERGLTRGWEVTDGEDIRRRRPGTRSQGPPQGGGAEPVRSLRPRRGRGAGPSSNCQSVSSGTHVAFQISALTRRGRRAGSTGTATALRGGGRGPPGPRNRHGSAQAAGEGPLPRGPHRGPRGLSPGRVSAPHPHPQPYSSSS